MKDADKAKEQLMEELAELRRRNTEMQASEIERERMEERIRVQRDLALSLSAISRLEDGLRLCIEAAIRVSGMDCGGAYLVDRNSGDLDVVYHTGLSPDFVKSVSHFDAGSDNARLVMAGKAIYTRHQELGVPLDESKLHENLRAMAVVPIRYEDRVIGCLNIASHTLDDVPTPARSELEMIASQMGSAIARLKAEEARRESEQRFRGIVEDGEAGYFFIDREGCFRDVNAAWLKMHGYSSPREVIGKHFSLTQTDENLEEAKGIVDRLLRGNSIASGEFSRRCKDGSVGYHTFTLQPVRRAEEAVGLEGFLMDITERKQIERALQESEERYRLLTEESPLGVCVIGKDGSYKYINTQFRRMFGYTLDDVPTGRDWFRKAYPDPEYRKEIISTWLSDLTASKQGEVRPRTFSVTCKDGEIKEILFRPVTMATGDQFMICEDITERKRAELALQESEAQKKAILDGISASIAFLNKDMEVLWANKTALEGSGKSSKYIIGHKCHEIWQNPAEVCQGCPVVEAIKTGKPERAVIFPPDGGVYDERAEPIFDAEGKLIGVVEISDNITEREQMRGEIEQRNHELAALNAIAAVVSQSLDLDEILDAALDTTMELMHLDAGGIYLADPVRRKMELAVHRGVSEQFVREIESIGVDRETIEAAATQGGARKFILSIKAIMKDGQGLRKILSAMKKEELSMASTVTVMLQAKEEILGVMTVSSRVPRQYSEAELQLLTAIGQQIATAVNNAQLYWAARQEIAVRKRVEEALLKERDKAQEYLDIAGVMLMALDADGRVSLINRKGCDILGYDEEEIVGADWFDNFLPQRIRDGVKYIFEELMSGDTGSVEYYENRILTRSGKERIIAWHNTILTDETGKAIGTLSSGEDITERRRMEEELLRIEKLESVGILAGGIAHDLNNFLTAIVGNISLAMMYESPSEKDRRLMEAEKACMQIKDLTQQLLTFSKGGTPIKELATIGDVLRDSAIFALRGSDVRCEFSLPQDLWPVEIDPGQISQVINNLVINADQAMPEGGIIKLRAENLIIGRENGLPIRDGTYIRISIEDQGIGMPENVLQKIFDPFFTTKQKGSGLGLASSYSIIQKHNGYITAESRIGVGTTFHIYLPASPDQALNEQKKTEDETIMGKGRVLVIDDEEHIREMATDMLGSLGYEAAISIDGSEAIKLYKAAIESGNPFDAVIADLTIPGGMGGREAIQKLREIDPNVKAIVSSGYSNDSIMADFRKYGFRATLAKPYKTSELSEVLHRVITEDDLS